MLQPGIDCVLGITQVCIRGEKLVWVRYEGHSGGALA